MVPGATGRIPSGTAPVSKAIARTIAIIGAAMQIWRRREICSAASIVSSNISNLNGLTNDLEMRSRV